MYGIAITYSVNNLLLLSGFAWVTFKKKKWRIIPLWIVKIIKIIKKKPRIILYNHKNEKYYYKNKGIKTFLDFFARVAISVIFNSAILGKITGFGGIVEYISSKGIPDPIASILLLEQ